MRTRMETLRWGAVGVIAAASLAFAGCSDDEDPTPEGAIEIEGLSETVRVQIDEEGIPRIRCATAPDCTAALGYVHARDRFIQMEVRRSFVRGQLHQIVLPSLAAVVVPIDQGNRTVYLNRDGVPIEEAAMEHLTDETRAMLQAYTRGVNVFLDEARADKSLLSDEFRHMFIDTAVLRPWTDEDSIASVVALVDGLTNSSSSELSMGNYAATFSEDIFRDLIYPRPVSPATTLFDGYPATQSVGASSSIEAQQQRASEFAEVLQQASEAAARRDAILGKSAVIGERGSNNWAVGAAKSASGNALLSDDPHLSHTNPATWYVVEMESSDGSMHVAGVTFAGLPWVILGQNQDIAWGATTTYFDQADVFLEELTDDGSAVVYDGEEVALLTYDISITRGGTEYPATAKIVPHHGPIIGEQDGKAVSLRWTGADLSTDVNFLTDLSKATDVEEARRALELVTTLGQNWVIIDTQGNFGWFPYNQLPVRTGVDGVLMPGLPLPGDGSVKWENTIPLSELPQYYNNPEGYVATANNDMTGQLWDGDPTNDAGVPVFQSSTADGLRQERILDLLAETDAHTQDTMLSAVGDTYMVLRDYVVPGLAGHLEGEDDAAYDDAHEIVTLLTDWSGFCPTGLATSDSTGAPSDDADERASAQGCLIFHRLVNDLRWNIFQDELFAEASPAPRAQLSALTGLLTDDPRMSQTGYWDDVSTTSTVETPAEIIAASIADTLAWLEEKLGADREDWLWGRMHRLTLAADLFPEFDVNTFNHGPFAAEGGLSTVNVAGPSQAWQDGFDFGHGASMRWICEGFAEGMSCTIQMPGGQVHHRDSPFYSNFLARWLTNTPHEMKLGGWEGTPSSELYFVAAP